MAQRKRGEDSDLDRRIGLRAGRDHPEAPAVGSQSLPNSTDSESHAFRENAHFTGASALRLPGRIMRCFQSADSTGLLSGQEWPVPIQVPFEISPCPLGSCGGGCASEREAAFIVSGSGVTASGVLALTAYSQVHMGLVNYVVPIFFSSRCCTSMCLSSAPPSRKVSRNPNQDGSLFGVASGRINISSSSFIRSYKAAKFCFRLCTK